MIRSEKLCEVHLSTSLLKGITCSDAARSSSIDNENSDCENRAKRENGNQVVLKRHGGSWVSHVPSRGKSRYVFTPILSGLRWPGQTVMGSWPPAVTMFKIKKSRIKAKFPNHSKRVRSFTSIQMFHTHASLPRGCFLATARLVVKLLSGP